MISQNIKNSLFYQNAKKIKNKIIQIKRNILGYLTSPITFKCDFQWFGNNYGGFYICPNLLLSERGRVFEHIIYSAGVGEDISFDEDMLTNFNCKIFAFDPTPKSIEWIQKQNMPPNFIFFPYGLSEKTEEKIMYLSNTPLDISASICTHEYTSKEDCITVQMKSIKDIAIENNHTYIDILKMDIEGSEFAVIDHFPKNIIFGQIIVEFHERFFKNSKYILKKAIRTLKKNGYYCFAVSKHGDEYSFINKKEYKKNHVEKFYKKTDKTNNKTNCYF